MKKFLVSFLMILFLSNPVFAFAPLVIPAIAIAVGASIGAAIHFTGLYYYMRPGGFSGVSPSGNVSRPSNVTWVDLTASPPAVKTKDITANISPSNLASLSTKKLSNGSLKYPALNAAATTPGVSAASYNAAVGDTIEFPWGGGMGLVTSVVKNSPENPHMANNPALYGAVSSPNQAGGGLLSRVIWGGADSYAQGEMGGSITTYSATTTVPPPKPATPVQLASNLSGSPSGGPLASNYQSEMDKMMQDPDYVPSFSDDTTGLPFSPPDPSTVATPQQLASYNASGQAAAATQQATDSSAAAAASAQAAAINASNAYAASGGNPSTGVGGDPALLQKFRDTQAIAATAQAVADKAAAVAADKAAADAVAAAGPPSATPNKYDSVITSPDKKDMLSKLTDWLSNSPLAVLARSLRVSTSSEVSSYTFNFRSQPIVVDFSRWDSFIAAAGSSLLLISHALALFIVLRKD